MQEETTRCSEDEQDLLEDRSFLDFLEYDNTELSLNFLPAAESGILTSNHSSDTIADYFSCEKADELSVARQVRFLSFFICHVALRKVSNGESLMCLTIQKCI